MFKELALNFLRKCNKENSQELGKLLRSRSPTLALTNIELAVYAKQEEFISHSSVQSVLDDIWYRDWKFHRKTKENNE